MSESKSSSSSGIGVLGLLGVVFVTLKLLGITAVAEWSWWYVTMPFWGCLALIFGIFAIVFLIAFCVDLYTGKKQNR